MPMPNTEKNLVVKMKKFHWKHFDISLIFVLTSTHNLCFGAKIRKIGIPLHTPVLLYKSGVQGAIHYTDMFFPSEKNMSGKHGKLGPDNLTGLRCSFIFNCSVRDAVNGS